MKERKLPEYYQFAIQNIGGYVRFCNLDGVDLPDYKKKLTPAQWRKAEKYLTRKLIPFCGYMYEFKKDYDGRELILIK